MLRCIFILLTGMIFFKPGLYSMDIQEQLRTTPVWHYPYSALIDCLNGHQVHSLLIFSYGSLMDIDSAKQTLSQGSLDTRRPAIGYGIRRLFDRDVPIKQGSKWCVPNDPEARGMLNVIVTNSANDFANGVLIDISTADLPPLLAREQGYDLVPICVLEWDSLANTTKPGYSIAYTFRAPQGTAYTNSAIKPRPGYYELTRNAAQQFGDFFTDLWFKTTFLADGQTPIGEWEKLVRVANPQTQSLCD